MTAVLPSRFLVILFLLRRSAKKHRDAVGAFISPCVARAVLYNHIATLQMQGLGLVQLEPNLSVDRKSTRLNSSHGYISYAVFCLKKKKIHTNDDYTTTQHDTR